MVRFLKTLFFTCFTVAVILAAAIFAVLQDAPTLDAMSPPAPEDVAATRQLVREIRSASQVADGSGPPLQTTVAELTSALQLGARFIDGFRGHISVVENEVQMDVSVPAPASKWLNATVRVPEFDQAFRFSRVRVGPLELPPGFALVVGRIGANLVFGNRFGDKVAGAATAMTINEDQLTFRMALDDMGKNGVMRSAFGRMRGAQMPQPEEIESYNLLIRDAMAEGRLQQQGSFLPYLQFALQAALDRSTPETLPNAYTAAVFGLAKVCGARDFAMIVGRLAFDDSTGTQNRSTDCSEVTFNDRIDSRRHFITAAALQAASNTGVAVSIGEMKELYDSISGAGGFDFTDLAANQSGIRLSNVLMLTPQADWPDTLARIKGENDVIVPFDGIPQIMTEEVFKERYQDVDSPAYKAEFAKIEAKIDQLAVYRAR